jgi:hypothetical protein
MQGVSFLLSFSHITLSHPPNITLLPLAHPPRVILESTQGVRFLLSFSHITLSNPPNITLLPLAHPPRVIPVASGRSLDHPRERRKQYLTLVRVTQHRILSITKMAIRIDLTTLQRVYTYPHEVPVARGRPTK